MKKGVTIERADRAYLARLQRMANGEERDSLDRLFSSLIAKFDGAERRRIRAEIKDADRRNRKLDVLDAEIELFNRRYERLMEEHNALIFHQTRSANLR